MALSLSEANAGAIVRSVLDAVHITADDLDVRADDFTNAIDALVQLAMRQTSDAERHAIAEIVEALCKLRKRTHEDPKPDGMTSKGALAALDRGAAMDLKRLPKPGPTKTRKR